MIVDDPYLASLSMRSTLFAAVSRCDDAGELPDIAPEALRAASSLWLFIELVEAVDDAVERLSKVT